MSVALHEDSPNPFSEGLGPYRAADYMALPDEPRCELIFGVLFECPRLTVQHQSALCAVLRLLWDLAKAQGGGAIVGPLDVKLADHSIVQPDVIYVSPERRHVLAERIDGAPDLVVEVLSPGSARRDRVEKLALYARSGIREYWIVDPIARQIDFFVFDGEHFRVAFPQGNTYDSPFLGAIEFDLAAFWREVGG